MVCEGACRPYNSAIFCLLTFSAIKPASGPSPFLPRRVRGRGCAPTNGHVSNTLTATLYCIKYPRPIAMIECLLVRCTQGVTGIPERHPDQPWRDVFDPNYNPKMGEVQKNKNFYDHVEVRRQGLVVTRLG